MTVNLKGFRPGRYRINCYRTGFNANDAYTAYLEIGSPPTLTPAQIRRLNALTEDQPRTAAVSVGRSGTATTRVEMRANDVVLLTIERLSTRRSPVRGN